MSAVEALSLLRVEEFLGSVRFLDSEIFEIDLNAFRKLDVFWTNLADAQMKVVRSDGLRINGVDCRFLLAEIRDFFWIQTDQVTSLGACNVLFSRSSRNKGVNGFWPEVVRLIRHQATFVGLKSEYISFTQEFGYILFCPTDDLLELARVIGGCSLFSGNQSCPFAIAEGLKKPTIQETDLVSPNCLFLRKNSLSVRLPREIDHMEPFIRRWEVGQLLKAESEGYANVLTLVRNIRPMASSDELEEAILKAKQAPTKTEEPRDPASQIAIAMVVHDDWYFLREAIRAYQHIGPVTAFVSLRAWNGDDGRWDKCASEAESVDAEVIIGDWPDEALHRRVALETMRQRGHRHVLIPDGDEIASNEPLDALVNLAKVGAADVVRVSMETYWKSPRQH